MNLADTNQTGDHLGEWRLPGKRREKNMSILNY